MEPERDRARHGSVATPGLNCSGFTPLEPSISLDGLSLVTGTLLLHRWGSRG